MDDRRLVVRFPTRTRDFSFLQNVQNTSGVQTVLPPGIKRPQRKACHSPASSDVVRMRVAVPTLHTPSKQAKGQLYLLLYTS